MNKERIDLYVFEDARLNGATTKRGTIGSTGNQYGGRKTKRIGDDVLNLSQESKWWHKTDHETGSSYKSTYYKGRKAILTAAHGFLMTSRRVEH